MPALRRGVERPDTQKRGISSRSCPPYPPGTRYYPLIQPRASAAAELLPFLHALVVFFAAASTTVRVARRLLGIGEELSREVVPQMPLSRRRRARVPPHRDDARALALDVDAVDARKVLAQAPRPVARSIEVRETSLPSGASAKGRVLPRELGALRIRIAPRSRGRRPSSACPAACNKPTAPRSRYAKGRRIVLRDRLRDAHVRPPPGVVSGDGADAPARSRERHNDRGASNITNLRRDRLIGSSIGVSYINLTEVV